MYRETLQVGEAFVNFSAGGAGWGDPAKRDPKAIDDDILDGLTSNDENKMKEEKP
jgi:N-methylhydantoinase B/oxoprolinase/acetone carboxylase alpha subunit